MFIQDQGKKKRNTIIENLGYQKPCVHQLSKRINCIIATGKLSLLKAKFYTLIQVLQVRYLMRGINGETLGLKCLNVGKILTI